MPTSTLEFIISVLFDFKYQRDIQEAVMFYFFYSFVQWFVCVVIGIFVINPNNDATFLFFMKHMYLIPLTFSMGLCIFIMIKKRLTNPFSLFLVLASALISISNIAVYLTNLFPAAILSTMEDMSPSKIVKQLEKERIEQEIRIESELAAERARSAVMEKMKKNEQDSA